jgi:hypothetical protein
MPTNLEGVYQMDNMRQFLRCPLSRHTMPTTPRSSTVARTIRQAVCRLEPRHNHPPSNVIDLFSNAQRKSWRTPITPADPAEILAWVPAEGL